MTCLNKKVEKDMHTNLSLYEIEEMNKHEASQTHHHHHSKDLNVPQLLQTVADLKGNHLDRKMFVLKEQFQERFKKNTDQE